jgi:hypothetical protein
VKAHPLPAGYSVIYDGQMKTFFAGIERPKLSGLWARLRWTPAPSVPHHPAVTGEAPARAAKG